MIKKIVLFNTLYYPYIVGGAERSTQLIAETLCKKGYDVAVISTGKQDEEVVVNGVKVYYVYIPNIFWRHEANSQNTINRSLWRAIVYFNFFTEAKIRKILLKEKPWWNANYKSKKFNLSRKGIIQSITHHSHK